MYFKASGMTLFHHSLEDDLNPIQSQSKSESMGELDDVSALIFPSFCSKTISDWWLTEPWNVL
jgi:hypothetical protein